MNKNHPYPIDVTALIQTEGFIVSENLSKGIVLKGIDPDSFKKVTGIIASVNNENSFGQRFS